MKTKIQADANWLANDFCSSKRENGISLNTEKRLRASDRIKLVYGKYSIWTTIRGECMFRTKRKRQHEHETRPTIKQRTYEWNGTRRECGWRYVIMHDGVSVYVYERARVLVCVAMSCVDSNSTSFWKNKNGHDSFECVWC